MRIVILPLLKPLDKESFNKNLIKDLPCMGITIPIDYISSL
jgi:hypothetical protein